MKKYDFKKTLQFNHDMLLSFEVDDFVFNEEKKIENFLADIGKEDKERLLEIYGDNLNRDTLKISLKKEIKRLTNVESEIEVELINYISNKIKSDRENTDLNNEKLKEYGEDLKIFNYYNFSNYKILYSYLFASKNYEDFEKITEAMSLKKNFLHYDVLFMKTLTDGTISENFKDRDSENLLDIYMNSKFGIKSINQYLSILNNSEDKFADFNFVNFQYKFLKDNINKISKFIQGEEINNKHLTEKTKELISGLGNKVRGEAKDILQSIKKNKSTVNELNDKMFLLHKVDDMFKLLTESIVKQSNDIINPYDKSSVESMLKSHINYMSEKSASIEHNIEIKKEEHRIKKNNRMKP